MNERITRPMSATEMMREIAAQAREAGCTCEWWTPPNGPNAGLPQRQLNIRNDCPVAGHNVSRASEANMSRPVGMKPTRSDADIRADLDRVSITELARWVNARADLTGETERWVQAVFELEAELARSEVLLREYMLIGPIDNLIAMKARLARVRALVAHAKNVSPSPSMTVYVTDLEAALEGWT